MTTAINVIHRSLEALGAHSVMNPAPPETLVDAFQILIELLEDLNQRRFRLPVRLPSEQGDNLHEPPGVSLMLSHLLAEQLSPITRTTITKELADAIAASKVKLKLGYGSITSAKRAKLAIKGSGNRAYRW